MPSRSSSPSKRVLQVSEQIRTELATMLARHEIADPRLQGVTLTSVKVTPDMKLAKIYFTLPEGKTKAKEALAGFSKASGYLRREIASRLDIRYTPELKFFFDEALEEAMKIDALLNKVRESDKARDKPQESKTADLSED